MFQISSGVQWTEITINNFVADAFLFNCNIGYTISLAYKQTFEDFLAAASFGWCFNIWLFPHIS